MGEVPREGSRCPCARGSSRASSPGLVPATRPAPSRALGTQASGAGPGRARGLALPSRSGRMKDTSSAFSFVLHLLGLFAASTGWAAPRGWPRASRSPLEQLGHTWGAQHGVFRHGNAVWVWLISAHPETLPAAVPSFLWYPQRWSPRLGDKWCRRLEWPWGLLSPPERSRRPGHVLGQSVVVLRAALCSQAVPAALAAAPSPIHTGRGEGRGNASVPGG